jgi:pimeloyl-ACP methyl ester carboxylesterase
LTYLRIKKSSTFRKITGLIRVWNESLSTDKSLCKLYVDFANRGAIPMADSSRLHEVSCQYQRVDLINFGVDPPQQPIAYRRQGAGIPVIMLHGFFGDGTNWLGVADRLATSGDFDLIRLDLLGFGESGKPSVRYNVAQEVEVVRQVIEKLALGPCYLLGHSFGGWVAAAFAIAHPTCVRGLCLVAPAGIRDDDFCGRYDHLRPLLWQTPVIDWVLGAVIPLANWLNRGKAMETIAWARRELNRQPAARSFLIDRLRPDDAIDTVEHQIHQIQTPTLVLAAEQDDTIPLWHCQTYAQRIPHATLHVIPEASHGLPQDHSEDIAQIFLQAFRQDVVPACRPIQDP